MCMLRFAAFRLVAFRPWVASLTFLFAAIPVPSPALDGAALHSEAAAPPANIVIGFVGGFVRHDNPHHGPVVLAQQIRRSFPQGTYIRIFENRRRKRAYDAVLHLLDTNRDGILSSEEKAPARLVLFAHSWGACAA